MAPTIPKVAVRVLLAGLLLAPGRVGAAPFSNTCEYSFGKPRGDLRHPDCASDPSSVKPQFTCVQARGRRPRPRPRPRLR